MDEKDFNCTLNKAINGLKFAYDSDTYTNINIVFDKSHLIPILKTIFNMVLIVNKLNPQT